MLVTGANGAGKTNLLEALHLGTQGFSPRTRSDAQVVRRGAREGRIALEGLRDAVPTTVEVTLALHEPKHARLNGAAVRSAEHLRRELTTLVFTPDRLAVVKSGPAARRAYFDRTLARVFPGRSDVPLRYATALGQRNAALRALAAGASSEESLAPWTQQVAELGASLVEARRELLELLAAGFRGRAGELGLDEARLEYDGTAPTVAELESRLPRDLDRGATGLGPHLHDIGVHAGDRDLRSFGSQGEQRLAVLSLLLCEAELLVERGSEMPLLLLDDALSELDGDRRRRLSERLGQRRPDRGHCNRRRGAAARAGTAPRGRARNREGGVMERLGDEIRGSLRSAGVPDAGLLADVTRAWPEAVGQVIAAAAWPSRIGRDETLHVNTTSSVWAFELTRLEEEIRDRLTAALPGVTPPSRMRFSVGPVPAPPGPEGATAPSPAPRPGPGPLREAELLAASVEDERLGELVRRAAAASLSARADDRHF